MFSVCVYCGAREGLLPGARAAAEEAGRLIAQRGWQLVYGGGRSGLMGAVADAALNEGGRVVGIIPQSLMQAEKGHAGLAELHVVETMHQRKLGMAERSHAFLALPGGIGTLEELFEIWTWHQLGYHGKPVALLNTAGYYDPLIQFTRQAAKLGYLQPEQLDIVSIGQEPAQLLETLYQRARQADASVDYGRT